MPLVALAPLVAHAQRERSLEITASQTTGVSALIDGEGFDTTARTMFVGTRAAEGGGGVGIRLGIEERRQDGEEPGHALLAMVEGSAERSFGPLAGRIGLFWGYNSLNRHASPLGYAFPVVGFETGGSLTLGLLRVEAVSGITSFAIFNGGGAHLRVGAGLNL